MLIQLGVRMLAADLIPGRQRLGTLVQRPTLRGVLRALGVATGGSFESLCKRVAALPAAGKRELRGFLLRKSWLSREECSDEAAVMVLAWPVHHMCIHVFIYSHV